MTSDDTTSGGAAPDRRTRIAAAAVTIIADLGPRALTHRAVDRMLDLPAGSTSYYFRTRDALLEATARHIVQRSRSTFAELLDHRSDPARLTAEYLDDLLTNRRAELIARYALLMESRAPSPLRELLEDSLFSRSSAAHLFPDQADTDAAASDFLSLLEGLIFDRCLGGRSRHRDLPGDGARQLHAPIDAYLRGLGST